MNRQASPGDAVPQADKIIQDLLTTVEQLEEFNRKANIEIKRLKDAVSPAYVEPDKDGRDLVMTEPVRDHVFALRESLRESVCRLYDTELITGSRACELLGGIKAQEFRELYTKWAESV